MEYLEENLDQWLAEELSGYTDDDYIIFDCPGQIELYSHLTVFRTFVDFLKKDGWNVATVYCLDSQFASDASKYISGCLTALSAMVQLELPHVSVLTKMDMSANKVVHTTYFFVLVRVYIHPRPMDSKIFLFLNLIQEEIEEEFLIPDPVHLKRLLDVETGPRFHALNGAVAQLLDDFSMVSFVPLDISDEESIEAVLQQVDMAIQYGEDQDVKTRELGDFPDDVDDNDPGADY